MNTKALICVAIAIFFSINCTKAQSTVGLVAHWRFDGNTGDSSINGHHGIANNISYTAGRRGFANTAAVFNGTSSYVSVPYQADLNLTNFSICAIVKPKGFYTGTCQTNALLWRGAQGTAGNYALFFYDNPYDGNCSTSDTSRNVFAGTTGNIVGNEAQWKYLPGVTTNQWYCVVLTYKTDTFRLYVDGLLRSTFAASSGSIGSSTDGLYIGANFLATTSLYPYWFNGILDDMMLYNRVLPASEISEHFHDVYMNPPVKTQLCKNVTFNVDYTTLNNFDISNTFSVELSDNTGSFAAPTILGTTSSNTSGTISCSVPSSVATGTGYKMRLVSTSPAKITDAVNVAVDLPTAPPGVTMSVAPSIYVLSGTTAFFSALPTNAGSSPVYQWRRNSMYIPGANSITYSAVSGTDFVTNDTITVVVKSSNICATPDSAVSNPKVMVVNHVGVSGIDNHNLFSIYPNPNKGSFTLNGAGLHDGTVHIQAVNTVGQVVYTSYEAIKNGILNKQINLDNINNGVYYLQLKTDSQTETLKIFIHQ